MRSHTKLEFKIKVILILAISILSGLMAKSHYEWDMNKKRIPSAARGGYVVFTEELTSKARIDKIDSTGDYIYILYSGFGVVAVYDWNGEYQFSMVFFTDTNGSMKMRCDNGLLYVMDHEHYEFVFKGNRLIQKVEPTDKENLHFGWWFTESTAQPLKIKDNMLYTQSGDFVMVLPGTW